MTVGLYDLEYYNGSAWVAIANGNVLNVSGTWGTAGDQNGVSFGNDTDADISADLVLSEWANLDHLTPIRYTTTIDATTAKTFVGVITKRQRDLEKMTFDAEGMKVLIAACKGYSPAFNRRPVATKTTASSVDDPEDANYRGGQINWLLWQAGGRPYEQIASYPDAVFYYSCDHALLAPDWSWAAGEDAWAECLRLAKDSGGQMYQDHNGVIRYKQVMGYGTGTASETLTISDFASIEQVIDPGIVYATKVTCQYVPRRRLGRQQVADDTTPRQLEPGETINIVIEPQNPIAALETLNDGGSQLKPDHLIVTQLDGTPVPQGSSGYTHALDIKAARVTITISNASSKPYTVWRVKLMGDPIVAGEAGSVSSGSGTVERVLEQSPYIQSATAAQRIADMTLAFYSAARPSVEVRGAVHNPSRVIGGAINLTVPAWSMTAQRHAILAIDHDQTGAEAGYTLANVSDLPTVDQFFIIGQVYTASDNKYLGW